MLLSRLMHSIRCTTVCYIWNFLAILHCSENIKKKTESLRDPNTLRENANFAWNTSRPLPLLSPRFHHVSLSFAQFPKREWMILINSLSIKHFRARLTRFVRTRSLNRCYILDAYPMFYRINCVLLYTFCLLSWVMCLQANVAGYFIRAKVEEARELVLRESYICCTFCVTLTIP